MDRNNLLGKVGISDELLTDFLMLWHVDADRYHRWHTTQHVLAHTKLTDTQVNVLIQELMLPNVTGAVSGCKIKLSEEAIAYGEILKIFPDTKPQVPKEGKPSVENNSKAVLQLWGNGGMYVEFTIEYVKQHTNLDWQQLRDVIEHTGLALSNSWGHGGQVLALTPEAKSYGIAIGVFSEECPKEEQAPNDIKWNVQVEFKQVDLPLDKIQTLLGELNEKLTTPSNPATIITINRHLKPCPFCGSEASFDDAKDYSLDGSPERWFVSCNNQECGCVMNIQESEDEAAILWNKRSK